MKTGKLIGVAGTAGVGKDTVAELLSRMFGLRNLSSGDVVRAITRHVYHLAPEVNPVRDQLYDVANYLRNDIDPAILVKICILEAKVQQLNGGIISGLRSMGEAQAIKKAGGIIIGVDADPKLRYERMYTRGRDAETKKTYEQFLAQDEFENKGLSDKGPGRGIRSIIDNADIVIRNEGTLEELEQQIKDKVSAVLQ